MLSVFSNDPNDVQDRRRAPERENSMRFKLNTAGDVLLCYSDRDLRCNVSCFQSHYGGPVSDAKMVMSVKVLTKFRRYVAS